MTKEELRQIVREDIFGFLKKEKHPPQESVSTNTIVTKIPPPDRKLLVDQAVKIYKELYAKDYKRTDIQKVLSELINDYIDDSHPYEIYNNSK